MPLCGKKKLDVQVTPISNDFMAEMMELFPDFLETLKDRIESKSILTKSCYYHKEMDYKKGRQHRRVCITKSIDDEFIHIDYYYSLTESIHLKHKIEDYA